MSKDFNFGPVQRWRDSDGILYAQNDFVRMAYVCDPSKPFDSNGFHGPRQVCVGYLDPARAAKWDGCPTFDTAPDRPGIEYVE